MAFAPAARRLDTAGVPATVADRPVVLIQTWSDIVWAHWRVDVGDVAGLLPPGVEVDTFDGTAWVGLIPFEMQDLRLVLAGRRLRPIGSTSSFSEINVRTYVTGARGPGVWFHSLDATSRLAVTVGRGAWSLPYRRAAVARHIGATRRSWTVRRPDGTTGALAAAVGEARPRPDDLADFLTSRYRLYAPLGLRHLITAPVAHQPWTWRAAEVESHDNGLLHAAGYRVGGAAPDHVLAGDAVGVAIGLPSILSVPGA